MSGLLGALAGAGDAMQDIGTDWANEAKQQRMLELKNKYQIDSEDRAEKRAIKSEDRAETRSIAKEGRKAKSDETTYQRNRRDKAADSASSLANQKSLAKYKADLRDVQDSNKDLLAKGSDYVKLYQAAVNMGTDEPMDEYLRNNGITEDGINAAIGIATQETPEAAPGIGEAAAAQPDTDEPMSEHGALGPAPEEEKPKEPVQTARGHPKNPDVQAKKQTGPIKAPPPDGVPFYDKKTGQRMMLWKGKIVPFGSGKQEVDHSMWN